MEDKEVLRASPSFEPPITNQKRIKHAVETLDYESRATLEFLEDSAGFPNYDEDIQDAIYKLSERRN